MNASKDDTKNAWIDPDDAPELTGDELDRSDARWRIAGKSVGTAQGRAAFRAKLGKRQVNMMLDVRVVEYFKSCAGGKGYQTLINKTLNEAMERESLEKVLRRIVREEIEASSR